MTTISTITILCNRLYIVSLSKVMLPNCAYALLKLFLFPKSERHFFSFTETSEEISLVLDEESLFLFPPHSLKVSATSWRALSVTLGSSGYNTGTVSTLSNILSKNGISLFYLSTANTDFVLVQESKLEKAIAALRQNFEILTEDDSTESKQSSGGQTLTRISELQQNFAPHTEETLFDPQKASNLTLLLLPDNLYLCSMSKESRSHCAQGLLQLVFFPELPRSFFSFTETEDEISLLISKEALKYFPEDVLTKSDLWRPIQRFRKSSFTEIGVIASLSTPLAKAKIPMLYISTFTSAFILVEAKNVSLAVMCLEGQKFAVKDYQQQQQQQQQQQDQKDQPPPPSPQQDQQQPQQSQ